MTKSTSKKITKRGHSIGKGAKGQACLQCYQKNILANLQKVTHQTNVTVAILMVCHVFQTHQDKGIAMTYTS